MKNVTLLLLFATLVQGCASDPIVDKRGVSEEKYQADLAECRRYAEQVNSPAEGVEQGVVGAVVGGAVGAILDDRHTSAGEAAAVGAVVGTTRGVSEGENRKERVLFNCLKGRGYHVLG
jgi:outer membrane lipoprotein SlyB